MTDSSVRTGRLLLRPVHEDDVDTLWRIYSDPRTNRFNPSGPLARRAQAAEVLASWREDWVRDGLGYWAVSLHELGDDVVGFAGLRRTQWLGRPVWNLHYRFAPESWGRGHATEAAREAVAVWRARGAVESLVARTTRDNVPSQRTALAAGLERRPDLDGDDGQVVATMFALGWD